MPTMATGGSAAAIPLIRAAIASLTMRNTAPTVATYAAAAATPMASFFARMPAMKPKKEEMKPARSGTLSARRTTTPEQGVNVEDGDGVEQPIQNWPHVVRHRTRVNREPTAPRKRERSAIDRRR